VGNPPSLLKLRDGRLALIYGYRRPPFGIRARISKDLGKTWSDEFVLRTDGGATDLTPERPDRKIVFGLLLQQHRQRQSPLYRRDYLAALIRNLWRARKAVP
jgi:hypothetical protein